MSRYRLAIFIIILIIGVFFAPLAFQIFHSLIIEPAAYYWWAIKQVTQVIPQSAYWVFTITSLGFVVLWIQFRNQILGKSKNENIPSNSGSVQNFAADISQSGKSNFFKWVIANHLANLTLKILDQQNGFDGEKSRNFLTSNWNPPQGVRKYLEAGLHNSFVAYHNKRRLLRKQDKTPFELDLSLVIDYIESLMES